MTSPLDEAHHVETPESTVLVLPLADIATRGVACLIDLALRAMALLSLLFVLSLLGSVVMSSTLLLVVVPLVVILQWLYFTLFEAFMGGRTPGKAIVGLRVVSEDGTPATLAQVAIRNLLRIIDSLPSFYGAGIVAIFVDRRHRRLGDLAAGTVVVRDETSFSVPRPRDPGDGTMRALATAMALGDDERDLIRRGLARRHELAVERQRELLASLERMLRLRLERAERRTGVARAGDPEGWWRLLEALVSWSPSRERGVSREAFVTERWERWHRLDTLARAAAGRAAGSLPPSALQELGGLYRQVSADLAHVQTFFRRDPLLTSLNALVVRAHEVVYGRRRTGLGAVRRFFVSTFPDAFRRRLPATRAAAVVFLVFAASGLGLSVVDESAARLFLTPEMVEGLRGGTLWTDQGAGLFGVAPASVVSHAIISNNVTVTLMLYASGLTLGLGTVYLVALNGLMLGTIVGTTARYGLAARLLEFIAAHGPLELTVIVVAGGAGMAIGGSLVAPGPLRRIDALKDASRDALALVGGGVPALIAAGIVEGFVSPSPDVPWLAKLALGLLLWLAFMTFSLRRPPSPT